MSKSLRIPKYSLHRPSGRARITFQGKQIYLGKYGSVESHQKYAEIVARISNAGLPSVPDTPYGTFPALTVDEVLLKYFIFAKSYYSSDGQPTKEYRCMMDAAKHLRERFSDSLASEFGPRKLAIVREDVIEKGLARTVINNRVNRIRRMFKWAVSMELIPPSVHQGLATLAGLKYGRSKAKESKPVRPVADAEIERVTSIASPQIKAMILLQRFTGMRPGEAVIMRSGDIDFSSNPWVYLSQVGKNNGRGTASDCEDSRVCG